ncbi:MAG TPA: hypothetical protein VG939_00440 [Caulobacteraceae bacterium]|nr:hypothetical protein [Caulobacteraceae bacterium]
MQPGGAIERFELGDQVLVLGPAGVFAALPRSIHSAVAATTFLRRSAHSPTVMRGLRAYWADGTVGRPLPGLTDSMVLTLTERAIRGRKLDAIVVPAVRPIDQVDVPVSHRAVEAIQSAPLAPSATPGTTVSALPEGLKVAFSRPYLPARRDPDVSAWTVEQRLSYVIRRAADRAGPEFKNALLELVTPKALATMAAITAFGALANLTPFGWAADALIAGIAFGYGGLAAIQAIDDLVTFLSKTAGAEHLSDLDVAADALVRTVVAMGVAGLMAILHRVAARRVARGGGAAAEEEGAATAGASGRQSPPREYRKAPEPAPTADPKPGIDLKLKYKEGWSDAQRAEAANKVKALNDAEDLVVTKPQRSGTSAASRYKKAGNTVPAGSDVDHTVDLQLGGADAVENMKPLDSSVNRSLGAQIGNKVRDVPVGTRVNSVTIGDD